MSPDFMTCRRSLASPWAMTAAMIALTVSAGAQPSAGAILISPSRTDKTTTQPAPATAAPAALSTPVAPPAGTTSPLNLLKTAPRVQFERDGDPVTVVATPAPPDAMDATDTSEELPDSAMPLEPRRPVAKSAPGQAEDSLEPAQPRRRPGIVRGMLRRVPLLGPVLVRDESERPSRRLGDRVPTDREPPDSADSAGPFTPPAERPVLFPPPPPRSELADETTTSATDEGLVPGLKQPASEDGVPTPVTVSTPTPGPAVPDNASRASLVSDQAPVTTASNAATAGVKLDPNDLALPNPSAEENEVLREKYTAAIIRAREGDHAGAAALLREYANSHLLSRLTPRALFLAAIMEPDPARAAESRDRLEKDFPASPYVTELRNRVAAGRVPALAAKPADGRTDESFRGASPVPAGASAPSPGPASPVSTAETDAEAMARLERFLASAPVGPQTLRQRLDLCRLYLKLKQPQRAESLVRSLLSDARGRTEEPEALDLLAEYSIAVGRMDEAKNHLEALIAGFPAYPAMAKVRLNMGLISEASGNYQRALAEYRAVSAGWPQTPEATLARERIRDVESLLE